MPTYFVEARRVVSSEKEEVPYEPQQYSVNVTDISEPSPRSHRDMHTQSTVKKA